MVKPILLPLTLPIQVGKCYVRRDGYIVIATEGLYANEIIAVMVNEGKAGTFIKSGVSVSTVFKSTGLVSSSYRTTPLDLVADSEDAGESPFHVDSPLYAKSAKKYTEDLSKPKNQWKYFVLDMPIKTVQPLEEILDNSETLQPHVHSKFIMEYACDAAKTKTPWTFWEFRKIKSSSLSTWLPCTGPLCFLPSLEYRRVPKKFMLNGIPVPIPMSAAPAYGSDYYYVDLSELVRSVWVDSSIDRIRLMNKICHSTVLAAIAHRDAILSLMAEI